MEKRKEMNNKDKEYNGWKNYQTWNVSLWINNDEPLYHAAVAFVARAKDKNSRSLYRRFIASMGLERSQTPDKVKWMSNKLALSELNAMLKELA